MAKRCLAAVCFALRLLRPSLVVMGIDPTFPPPARRTLQKSATIMLIRKSLLDPMPPALHRRLYDRKCGLEVAGDASRAEAAAASRIHLYGFDRFLGHFGVPAVAEDLSGSSELDLSGKLVDAPRQLQVLDWWLTTSAAASLIFIEVATRVSTRV